MDSSAVLIVLLLKVEKLYKKWGSINKFPLYLFYLKKWKEEKGGGVWLSQRSSDSREKIFQVMVKW